MSQQHHQTHSFEKYSKQIFEDPLYHDEGGVEVKEKERRRRTLGILCMDDRNKPDSQY